MRFRSLLTLTWPGPPASQTRQHRASERCDWAVAEVRRHSLHASFQVLQRAATREGHDKCVSASEFALLVRLQVASGHQRLRIPPGSAVARDKSQAWSAPSATPLTPSRTPLRVLFRLAASLHLVASPTSIISCTLHRHTLWQTAWTRAEWQITVSSRSTMEAGIARSVACQLWLVTSTDSPVLPARDGFTSSSRLSTLEAVAREGHTAILCTIPADTSGAQSLLPPSAVPAADSRMRKVACRRLAHVETTQL